MMQLWMELLAIATTGAIVLIGYYLSSKETRADIDKVSNKLDNYRKETRADIDKVSI